MSEGKKERGREREKNRARKRGGEKERNEGVGADAVELALCCAVLQAQAEGSHEYSFFWSRVQTRPQQQARELQPSGINSSRSPPQMSLSDPFFLIGLALSILCRYE